MPYQRFFDPANLGILSRLPLEIRQSIYDHMCRIDSPVYEFEIEGPNNIHIPVTTLELLQNPQVPRIAHVCTEMRDYALGSARTPISFTCYVFGVDVDQIPQARFESVLERRDIKTFFRFKSDSLTFKPHEMIGMEEFDFGEGDYYDFIRTNDEAWRRVRVFLFPGSGGLPSSQPEGYTCFEEFVQARRDNYVAEHPEAATAQRTSRRNDLGNVPSVELVKQQRPRYALLERSYDLSHL